MKVGIIGAGFIGNKRADALRQSGDTLVSVADIDIAKAKILQIKYGSKFATNSYEELINYTDNIEAVVVATTHNNLSPITNLALKNGKHVLCEKPLGINFAEIKNSVEVAKSKNLIFKAGYNHRFHPAILKAKLLLEKEGIGKLMCIKATYGHGGRPGYEREWRMNRKLSGGGELIDQGSHLIDLATWFSGQPFKQVKYELQTAFWKIHPVEDNVFLLLRNAKCVASLHASWTQWKNKFIFEIFGSKGYIIIDGLGGSYGKETLTHGIRNPGKAPKETVWKFSGVDNSWLKEWKNFKNAIYKKGVVCGSGEEGLKTMAVINKVYKQPSN